MEGGGGVMNYEGRAIDTSKGEHEKNYGGAQQIRHREGVCEIFSRHENISTDVPLSVFTEHSRIATFLPLYLDIEDYFMIYFFGEKIFKIVKD